MRMLRLTAWTATATVRGAEPWRGGIGTAAWCSSSSLQHVGRQRNLLASCVLTPFHRVFVLRSCTTTKQHTIQATLSSRSCLGRCPQTSLKGEVPQD